MLRPTQPCTCRHCATPAAAENHPEPEPIQLPATPTPIRVHRDGHTQDCTLHPDGTLTTVIGGQPYRNLLTFAEMRERNWQAARIEFDPGPLADEPEPEAEAVQEPLVPSGLLTLRGAA